MNLLKNNVRAKEMAKELGVHTAPTVGLSLVFSIHIGQLTATYSCSSWGIRCLLSLGALAYNPASQFSAGTSMSSKAVFQKDFHYSASVADHDVPLWR